MFTWSILYHKTSKMEKKNRENFIIFKIILTFLFHFSKIENVGKLPSFAGFLNFFQKKYFVFHVSYEFNIIQKLFLLLLRGKT